MYSEKTIIQKDTCNPMFIAAVFTTKHKTWKQPMNKEWYIQTMEY